MHRRNWNVYEQSSHCEEKNKQKRLKLDWEVQYAKAASVILLSKINLIFRIINVKNGKKTTKSTEEFADNLKILFGKTQEQDPDEVDTMHNRPLEASNFLIENSS